MAATGNRQILLVETPKGKLGPEHFQLTQAQMPAPKDGEALLRVRYISLDAANRAWMQGATYREAVVGGSVMAGGAIAEVVESKAPGLAAGRPRVRRHRLAGLCRPAGKAPHQAAEGRTSYPSPQRLWHRRSHGLLRPAQHCRAQGRRNRGRVGGGRLGRIARGPDRQDQGLPRGRHRRRPAEMRLACQRPRFRCRRRLQGGPICSRTLKEAAPKGIDVYFDNVGGDILEACLFQMNNGGRISCCGAISAYDGAAPPAGPRGVPGLIVVKRLTMKGFIVMDFFASARRRSPTSHPGLLPASSRSRRM